jgi:hypothetical protein
MTNLRSKRWADRVVRMREMRNGKRILIGKLEGKKPVGRIILK